MAGFPVRASARCVTAPPTIPPGGHGVASPPARSGRESFSTVWTGRELIVFGGSIGDGLATPAGAAYDPVSDHWRILPAAPIAVRVDHAAVWTGREMLVWGGRDGRRSVGDGAAYDPRTDRWRPIAGRSASSVAAAAWTGTRMLVWMHPRPTAAPPAPCMTGAGPVDGDRPRSGPERPAGRLCRPGRWSGETAWARRWSGPAVRW